MTRRTTGTVIVVDDDLSVRRSLSRLLQAAGHDVALFGSATDVLARTAFPRPSCFIVDINMPGTNGFDLLEAVREREPNAQVILISGDVDSARMMRAHSAGAVACLAKPFDADEFLAIVERALHAAEAAPAS